MFLRTLQNYYNNPSQYTSHLNIIYSYCRDLNKDHVDIIMFITMLRNKPNQDKHDWVRDLSHYIIDKYTQETPLLFIRDLKGKVLIFKTN